MRKNFFGLNPITGFNRRFRITVAFLFSFFIVLVLLFIISSALPHYFLTLGRLTLLTPPGFKLGQLYDFNNFVSSANAGKAPDRELVLPRPDNRAIIFKYPQVVSLGRPTFLGNEITQSVDFTVRTPPATGLIQIWVLTVSFDDFLTASKNYSTIEFLSFESKKGKNDGLNYVVWNYTFKNEDKTIRALEAFFDDPPYLYRISVFVDDKEYNADFQKLFEGMIKSVTVR